MSTSTCRGYGIYLKQRGGGELKMKNKYISKAQWNETKHTHVRTYKRVTYIMCICVHTRPYDVCVCACVRACMYVYNMTYVHGAYTRLARACNIISSRANLQPLALPSSSLSHRAAVRFYPRRRYIYFLHVIYWSPGGRALAVRLRALFSHKYMGRQRLRNNYLCTMYYNYDSAIFRFFFNPIIVHETRCHRSDGGCDATQWRVDHKVLRRRMGNSSIHSRGHLR